MIKGLMYCLTFWIPLRALRRKVRERLLCFIWGIPVRLKAKKVGVGLKCRGAVYVTKHTELADHVSFGGALVSGNGKLTIGRYFHSGDGLRIFTRNHNYNTGTAIPYDTTYITKDVVIEDFVWVGAQVILLPGTHLGEGCIIQAGSVVHGIIPAMAIAGGNPAKVFAQRDVEHFQQLKAAQKFH